METTRPVFWFVDESRSENFMMCGVMMWTGIRSRHVTAAHNAMMCDAIGLAFDPHARVNKPCSSGAQSSSSSNSHSRRINTLLFVSLPSR